jgi:DNA-binding NtrC family response regulator
MRSSVNPTSHGHRTNGHPEAETWLREAIAGDPFIGRLFERIQQFAALDGPVLIAGEVGTGRERVARALHSLSRRAAQPFVVLSCVGGSSAWLEAELLGVDVEGAGEKLGAIEQAGEGTLLLTDIEELPLLLQDAVVGLIRRHEVRRLNADTAKSAPARCLATTSVDLRARVADGRFRQELYEALTAHVVALPPLRERLDELPVLVQHFLAQHSGSSATGLSAESLQLMRTYDWPGNLRELRAVVGQAAVAAGDRQIEASDLPARFSETAGATAKASLRDVEMRHILRVLDGVRGNQRVASRILGISRWSLARRLEKYDLRGRARMSRRRPAPGR